MAKDVEHKGMKTSTALDAASLGANGVEFIAPKVIDGLSTGVAQGVMGPAGFVLQTGAGVYRVSEEEARYAETLGMSPEQYARASHTSNALKELRNREDEKRAHSVGNAATSSTASLAGAAVGSALLPGVGTIVGAIGGGIGASVLYDMALVGADKDVALLAVDIDGQQRAISREESFALLTSNLLPEQKSLMLKDLEKQTGHNNFMDALNDQGIPTDIMDKYESTLRTYTQIQPDGTGQDVATQLASQINAGQMSAKDLLLPDQLIRDASMINQHVNAQHMQITGGQTVTNIENPLPTMDGGTFAQHEAGRRNAAQGHRKPGVNKADPSIA